MVLVPISAELSRLVNYVLSIPAPIIGGMVGGLLTGGLFGWIGHLRNIRPVLVFFRDDQDEKPKWKIKNVGQGAAMHIRIRDYDSAGVVIRRVHPYAIEPGCGRPLDWVTAGARLEADYTDVYGRRWYKSVAQNNDTVFCRRHWNFWRRPAESELTQYEADIHVLKSMRRDLKK